VDLLYFLRPAREVGAGRGEEKRRRGRRNLRMPLTLLHGEKRKKRVLLLAVG